MGQQTRLLCALFSLPSFCQVRESCFIMFPDAKPLAPPALYLLIGGIGVHWCASGTLLQALLFFVAWNAAIVTICIPTCKYLQ